MTIKTIATTLAQLSDRLEKGELGAEEIEEMTNLSNQLYERLVVLRFKAYEEVVKSEHDSAASVEDHKVSATANIETEKNPSYEPEKTKSQEIAEPAPEAIKNAEEPIETKEEPIEEERPIFRLDTEPVPSNQISLIDSIEEIRRMEKSLNDTFADQPASLAEKLNKSSVANLKTAMSVNQKFKFIAELFNNDAKAFETAIEQINSCKSFIEADEYIQNQLTRRFEWEKQHPTVKEIMTLVERRFL